MPAQALVSLPPVGDQSDGEGMLKRSVFNNFPVVFLLSTFSLFSLVFLTRPCLVNLPCLCVAGLCFSPRANEPSKGSSEAVFTLPPLHDLALVIHSTAGVPFDPHQDLLDPADAGITFIFSSLPYF